MHKKSLFILLTILLPTLTQKLNAQCFSCGYPMLSTNCNVSIPCYQTCTTLTASANNQAQTTAYAVSPIEYAAQFPFDSGTNIPLDDDTWTDTVAMPFNFCFFGHAYHQFVIGANGAISFNTANANHGNHWYITSPAPVDTPADLTNSIMAPWQDIDPSLFGEIFYYVTGTAPYRKLVVSWHKCPMYGDWYSINNTYCTRVDSQTQQIVLYESTNIIDINIKHKSILCNDLNNTGVYSPNGYWNGGLAIEGIVNDVGTTAYTVPGRNATQWAADNDAYRFTPNAQVHDSILWYQDTTLVGTGDNITVCPAAPATYAVKAIFSLCNDSVIILTDHVHVTPGGDMVVNIDSVDSAICLTNTGAVYASFNPGHFSVDSFGWSPGGANQTSLSNLGPGTYIFYVAAQGCSAADTVVIPQPPVVSFTWDSLIAHGLLNSGSAFWCTGEHAILQLAGGSPFGGNYTGDGIFNNTIYLDSISFNIFGSIYDTITYTININGCVENASNILTLGVCEGIDAVTFEQSILLYPNPTNNVLVVQSSLFNTNIPAPQLYDITGKQIETMPDRQQNEFIFNTANLAPGMYFIQLNTGNNIIAKRFVKVE